MELGGEPGLVNRRRLFMVARQVRARKMLPMLEFAATVFVTFLVIIDPVGTLPLFVALTHRQPKDERRLTAIRSIRTARTST